jgi:mannose-6-phosphate isomerase-like protein (cupin superfamily)
MISAAVVVVTLSAIVLLAPAARAQTGQTAGRPTTLRQVLASGPLRSVVDAPVFFRVVRVSLGAEQPTTHAGLDGVLYQMTGTLALSGASGGGVTLREGEGAFVSAVEKVTAKAGPAPATYLYFVLVREPDLKQPLASGDVIATELRQPAGPLPGLKPGPYEFSLTRVTFPPRFPRNAPHMRSGGALYFILSGTGLITVGGTSEPRGPGALQYEPHGFVHQWENAGDTPFVILQANISPEGLPAVIFTSPTGSPPSR